MLAMQLGRTGRTTSLHGRAGAARLRPTPLLLVLVSLALPAAARGQGAFASGVVQQHVGPGAPTVVAGCGSDAFGPGYATPAAIATSCVHRGATHEMAASASFGGAVRSRARTGPGMQAVPPGFDQRVATASGAGVNDRLFASGGAFMTLYARLTGVSRTYTAEGQVLAHTQTWGAFTSSAMPFARDPFGPGPSAWSAYVGVQDDGTIYQDVASFVGTHAMVAQGGLRTATTDGWVVFHNIPVLAGGTPFQLLLNTYTSVANLGAVPRDLQSWAEADFGNSLTLWGARVFDAAGAEVTSSTTVTLASGRLLLAGNPTVVPEPKMVGLLGGGLLVLGLGLRRRAQREEAA